MRADADQDGALSPAEFEADARAYFARVDANGDGSATSVESTALWRREAPEALAGAASGPVVGPGGSGPEGRGRGRGGGGPGGGGPAAVAAALAAVGPQDVGRKAERACCKGPNALASWAILSP